MGRKPWEKGGKCGNSPGKSHSSPSPWEGAALPRFPPTWRTVGMPGVERSLHPELLPPPLPLIHQNIPKSPRDSLFPKKRWNCGQRSCRKVPGKIGEPRDELPGFPKIPQIQGKAPGIPSIKSHGWSWAGKIPTGKKEGKIPQNSKQKESLRKWGRK